MTRQLRGWAVFCVFSAVFASSARAQKPPAPPPANPPAVQEQEPPEEDESLKPKEYAFNPLQASQDLKVGDFYFKKRSYKAAARRFEEATHWDPTNAQAYLRLGEAREKLKDEKAAKAAYAKYLELAPDSKDADLIRKKVDPKPSAGK